MKLRRAFVAASLLALSSCAGVLPSAPSPMLGQSVRFELRGDHEEKIVVPAPKARATVIEIWSPTCQSCKERVSTLVAREAEILQKGAKLILMVVLSEGEAPEDAGKALESWGVRAHPFAIDNGDVMKSSFGLTELPATVILRGDKLHWVAPASAEASDVVNAIP
jgi:hypothetical protein